jgi:phage/plasmid-like protein (TIGR03299 family)
VRVVCNNTLTRALAFGQTFRVRHDRDMSVQLEDTKAFLGIVRTQFDQLTDLFQRLAKTRLQPEQARSYFEQVFPDGATADTKRRSEDRRRWSQYFYEHGRGHDLPAVRGTLWAAFNGVTELMDHQKARGVGPDFTTRRLGSIWFGAGAGVKERALQVATTWTDVTFRSGR